MIHHGEDPHGDQPIVTAGTDRAEADAAVVAVHGRGATARSILQFAAQAGQDGVTYLAPQAAGNTWYPNSFLAPMEDNEPGLSSGLKAVGEAVSRAADAVGRERTVLVGFSQGACLASEFVARNARRYGGMAALSGGVIGPDGTPREYDGDLDGTSVFLGCDANDPHIPRERVRETAAVFEGLGGDVTERIYDDLGHGINEEELEYLRELIAAAIDA